ncbi:hypothetical protein BH10BDE1_BH10BDE1_03630 [soil metagenome]
MKGLLVKKVSLYTMSLFYFAAGMNHFVNPAFYLPMIPPFLPSPIVLNALSGGAELILAAMLIRPEVRSLGAWGAILLLIAVFPANVYMYSQGGAAFGVPDWALLLRLPLQLVLIGWAYWHTKNPELDRHRIEVQIEIDAAPAKVWPVLMSFAEYPEWNPFIIEAKGQGAVGEQMEIQIKPPGNEAVRFRNQILENKKNELLAWRGSFLVRGLFDGTHYFRLEKVSETKTRFTQGEIFEGLFVGMLKGLLSNTEKGFRSMNAALKSRVESR